MHIFIRRQPYKGGIIITGTDKRAEARGLSLVGLTDAEVRESAARHGKNIMSRKKKKGFLGRFFSNLGDPVIKILIGALILNVIFTFRHADWIETGGIALSVILATMISTFSECGSEAAFEKLNAESAKRKCRVIRGGEVREIDIADVVVGDVVSIGAGEQIPADGKLLQGRISLDQSAMTGESREVEKRAVREEDADDRSPSSPYYCLRGCNVLSGSGIMEICAVGDRTFLGGISREIQSETRESPLRVRLGKLAKQISVVGYIAAILIAAIYLVNVFVIDSAFDVEIMKYKLTSLEYLASHLLHALTLGLTVLIVAVPEGLPMMVAVVLSSNTKKMVKDQVLVRKAVGIEAAGSLNILFTDKTGTLTVGKLAVGDVYLGNGYRYDSASKVAGNSMLLRGFALNALANGGSAISRSSSGKVCAVGGNSTDVAILNYFLESRGAHPRYDRTLELPFDSEKKYSCAQVTVEGRGLLLVKGAPEKLIPYLTRYVDEHGDERAFSLSAVEELCDSLTRKGKRVLMLAQLSGLRSHRELERGDFGALTLLCIVTLEDRIKAEAKASVESLRGAGIHVVMITGDNKMTGEFIARSCGIIGDGIDVVLSGDDMARMSDAAIRDILPRLAVVARALPSDKSRLVRISQELDLVVGMTGDGINDAPALKLADVGFAMGSGTQVAKEAGDIIILDNDLASIVKAVLYGRNIFKSIRKFITLQLTMNFCAVGVSMICPFFGISSPVTVVQMLWINIIMDTLGGLAFAGEPALKSCMQEKPKRRDEPILNGYMINQILLQGSFTVALCVAFLTVPEITSHFRWAKDNIYLMTAFFALFIFTSVLNCFNARTDRLRLFANISENSAFIIIMTAVLLIQIIFVYLGGAVLRTAPLMPMELIFTSLVSLLVIPADFLRKLIYRVLFGKKGY